MVATVKRLRAGLLLTLLLPVLFACTEAQWQQAGVDVLNQLNKAAHNGAPLTLAEIDDGLREALRVGSQRVVTQVGQRNGYNGDATIRIPLPDKLAKARDYAKKFGLDKTFNEVEIKLNRAAERAAPLAKDLFWQAIRDMRMADVRAILDGPADAATRYFEGKMRPSLAQTMRPVVDRSLNEVGAIRSYNRALKDYNAIPLAPKFDYDLTGYVVGKGMDGLFHYLAEEEAAIRRDPLKRTTEILQRVFGQI